jgi:hypothetical protein
MSDTEITLDNSNDSIAADWDRIRAETPTEEVPEKIAKPVEEKAEVVEEKPARERAPDGKFAPKAPIEELPVEVIEAEPLAGEPKEAPAVESPKSLRKELAEKHWGKLDPEIQQAWTERDANYERGIQRYRERAEAADRLESAFAPYTETLRQVGATPEQAIQTLLGMDHILRAGQPAEKAALIAQLAQQFNVPLEHLPQVGPMQQQLLAQAQQLQQHRAQQTVASQQQAQRELDSLTSEVIQFSEGKEHFGTVSQEMFAILPTIRDQFPNATPQEKLQKAYDIAVQANPAARAAIAAQQQQAQRAEALKKANEAKKSASVNRTPRGVIPTQAAVGSMEDTIRETAKQLGFA